MPVCLFPLNVKTAELIGPKFCVGPHMTPPGKVYEWSKFQKFVTNKIWFILNLKIHNIFFKRELFLGLFYNVYKEKMFKIEMEEWRPKSLV